MSRVPENLKVTFVDSEFKDNNGNISSLFDKITFINSNFDDKLGEDNLYTILNNVVNNQVNFPKGIYYAGNFSYTYNYNNIIVDGNGSRIIGINNTFLNILSPMTFKNFIFENLSLLASNGGNGVYRNIVLMNCTFENCELIPIDFHNGGTLINVTLKNCTNKQLIHSYYPLNVTNLTINGKNYNGEIEDTFYSYLKDGIIRKGTEIKFESKNYTSFYQFPIIGENLIIDGQGSNITSEFGDSVFYIKGNNITIKNFNIKNADTAIRGLSGNVDFPYSSSTIDKDKFSNYYIDNVNLSNCNHGFYVTNANVSVSNSNFSNVNLSIACDKSVNVTNCYFTDSANEQNGGAIYAKEYITVSGSHFSNITSKNGGAIYGNNDVFTTTIKNCEFTNCEAIAGAGAIFSKGKLIVEKSNFTNNTADYGGALSTSSELKINGSEFTQK